MGPWGVVEDVSASIYQDRSFEIFEWQPSKTRLLLQIDFFSLKPQRLIYATACQDLGGKIVKIDWVYSFEGKKKTLMVLGER